jgi:hypothetical protein
MAYRVRQGREFVIPPAGLSYTGQCVARCVAMPPVLDMVGDRFLYQMDHLGQENYKPSPVLERALDVQLYNGASDRQFTGGPIFCYRVSEFCDTRCRMKLT